jgi:predicted DNA-binding transcriptional regulator AlpA
MKQIQLIGITPDEFQEAILDGVEKLINELKKDFQPKEPTEYLTRQETAQFFQVNLTTIWNWTKKGKIQAYGLGNRVYYKRSEIESAIVKLNY